MPTGGFGHFVRNVVKQQQAALDASRGTMPGVASSRSKKLSKKHPYDNPIPTVRACGTLLDKKWGRLGKGNVAVAAAAAMVESDAASDAEAPAAAVTMKGD